MILISKSAKFCDWDFQSENLIITWAHEWHFRSYQKTILTMSKFAIQARGSKQQNMA